MRKTIAGTASVAVIYTGRHIRHAFVKRHNANLVLRLSHTEPRMWIADVQGGRYFTHFEVLTVIELTAGMLERANTGKEKD